MIYLYRSTFIPIISTPAYKKLALKQVASYYMSRFVYNICSVST